MPPLSPNKLSQTLNDPSSLGDIYQGLAKYIVTRYGDAKYLPNLMYRTCYCSPTTRPLHILKAKLNMHIESTETTFPLQPPPPPPPLHTEWYNSPFYTTLIASQKANTTKFITKLAAFNITTIQQIQDSHQARILTYVKFQTICKTKSCIIKATLLQACTFFPPSTLTPLLHF